MCACTFHHECALICLVYVCVSTDLYYFGFLGSYFHEVKFQISIDHSCLVEIFTKQCWLLFNPLFSMHFVYFQNLSIKVPTKFQNYMKGGVHSSRIKCKGVQLTQKTGTSSPISWKMLRSIHPENKNIGCSLTFFSLFLYSDGSSPTFFRKWASSCQFFELTEHPYI